MIILSIEKEGMKKLTAGFLNEVMQLEAENQIQARPMNGLARDEHTATERDREN